MAVLFPITQFFNNAGLPLTGGTITLSAAGGSTPKNGWTNQAGNVALPNPVVLDTNGRPQPVGQIWLEGAYRIIVADSNGNQMGQTIDNVDAYDLVDWTGLTATVSQINSTASALGTAGTVVASKGVVVDSSKNISTFGSVTASTFVATTAVQTPVINDINGVAALTIATVASQNQSIEIIPAATGNSPIITSTGSALSLRGQGTGAVQISGLLYPATDGTNGQGITTNGAGTLSFNTVLGIRQIATTGGNVSCFKKCAIPCVLENECLIEGGTDVMTCTIIPTSAESTLIIEVQLTVTSDDDISPVVVSLYHDSNILTATQDLHNIKFNYIMHAGTTDPMHFKVCVAPTKSKTAYFNGTSNGDPLFGGISTSSMIITEKL